MAAGAAECCEGAMRVVRFARSRGRREYAVIGAVLLVGVFGCHRQMTRQADRDVAGLIRARQQTVLGEQAPVEVGGREAFPRPGKSAYDYAPSPSTTDVPEGFAQPASQPASDPAASMPATTMAARTAATAPAVSTQPVEVFTLTDALAYAQRHRREYQTAKEDLYLSALALTLERHLWTPIFASDLKTVYGNYGEVQDFDQAMRFVADLSVAQRLPYGGEFTAKAISTLIRDVGKTITASEDSAATLDLRVPLLRGAGHVARETLIQLERELTYSVRVFERFRRRQMISVAQAYFRLLLAKETMINSEDAFANFVWDFEQAKALEAIDKRTPLNTALVQDAMLSAANQVELDREGFRSEADNFKLLIGMPVVERLDRGNLADIRSIERQIADGTYPLLARPAAVDAQESSVDVALQRRFDLLTANDRIDDARRGVAISQNALLPELDWSGSVGFDTDPSEYNLGGLQFDRANWRTELILSLPLERTAERNALRQSLIDVRRAQRAFKDKEESIRVDVRDARNSVLVAERSRRFL